MIKAIVLLLAIAGVAAFVLSQRKADIELSAEFESPNAWPTPASSNGASAEVGSEAASAS